MSYASPLKSVELTLLLLHPQQLCCMEEHAVHNGHISSTSAITLTVISNTRIKKTRVKAEF
jgi:hypothetical protein